MLEDAGYLVYAPTLPYHAPNTQWTPNQGELKAQDYVDYLKAVRHQRAVRPSCLSGSRKKLCMYIATSVVTECSV